MKISLSNKKIAALAKAYTRVTFIEKGVERFVKEGEITRLEIVSGKLGKVTPRTFRTLIRSVVQAAHKHKLEKIAFAIEVKDFPKLSVYGTDWLMSTVVENLLLADYTFTTYKSKPEKPTLTEALIFTDTSKEALAGFKRGLIVGENVNHTRDIANTPGGDMTPKLLAEKAKALLKGTKATVTVLDEKVLTKLGMGGVLGVGCGAKDKPRFIIIEYWGAGKPRATKAKNGQLPKKVSDPNGPIVLVGKGITFDTGGLQVKPGMSMYEMHMDMSGGAAVIGAIKAVAELGLKQNVIGLIPAAENAISDCAMRPGDVLHMHSGHTVDVLHTDAEGRLVLADALHYAKRYTPRLVIDVATLTGAALVAVGQHAHVIMTKDRALEDTLRELGEESGDLTFPLPLWDEYKQYTKGVHGDIANVPHGDARYGGSINGGTFLSHFTKGIRWAHIDMAPRMTSVATDKLAKGATGEPVRLLVKIVETM